MDFFEKDGVIYKSIPAGGHGGGVTGSVVVKATEGEAAAFRATLAEAAPAEAAPAAPEAPSIMLPEADARAIEAAIAKAEADVKQPG